MKTLLNFTWNFTESIHNFVGLQIFYTDFTFSEARRNVRPRRKLSTFPGWIFATSHFISHSFFWVQASLNSGKLQQDILQLVKQADNSANSLPNGERERQILETYMESIIENGLEEPVTSILLLNSALK